MSIDKIEMGYQIKDIIKTAESIYGDRWEETKSKYVKILKIHKEQNKTKNLLASAIQMSKKLDDERYTIVLIASSQ